MIEPYLIQLGLIARTARGRCLNGRGYAHLGLTPPPGSQSGLFDPGAALQVIRQSIAVPRRPRGGRPRIGATGPPLRR